MSAFPLIGELVCLPTATQEGVARPKLARLCQIPEALLRKREAPPLDVGRPYQNARLQKRKPLAALKWLKWWNQDYMGRKLTQELTNLTGDRSCWTLLEETTWADSCCGHEVVLGGTGPPSPGAALPFILANGRGRAVWEGNLDLLAPQGPRLCAGYTVTPATRLEKDSWNVDGPRNASREHPAAPTAERAGAAAAPARTAPPPARSPVLTWSAQVGLGRGRRPARRRGSGASPLPTSQAGAHLGDSERKRSLASASPGNAGGPGGGGGGGAGLSGNCSDSNRSRRRHHLHLALGHVQRRPAATSRRPACPPAR